MTDTSPNIIVEEEIHHCPIHPEREASLRCIRCERWMCVSCAVRTPVGYICRECDRKQDDKFFTSRASDYLVVGVVSASLSAVGGLLALFLGWFIFAFLIGGLVGAMIGEAGRRATGRRVGRRSGQVAALGVAIGALLSPSVFIWLRTGIFVLAPQIALQNISLLIYLVLAAASAYAAYQRRI